MSNAESRSENHDRNNDSHLMYTENVFVQKNMQAIFTHVRLMIRRDVPAVLDIEGQSFEFPWSEGDFIRCLRQRHSIGMVSEFNEQVIGFMIYELQKKRLHILNLAVHSGFRKRGVGTAMVDKLAGKLSHQRRSAIFLEVSEKNLPAQLFFSKNDFLAVEVLRDFYDDTADDAYQMRYDYQGYEEEGKKHVNRTKRMGTR